LGRQLRLDLDRASTYDRADFIASPANEDALRLLDAWPQWHSRVLALVGPPGSGKTHLARGWAAEAGAVEWGSRSELIDVAGRPVLLEDADRGFDAETLFHLINMAAAGGGLLLTGRTPPSAWAADLPDLRSRLKAMQVALLQEPDDLVLLGVMSKLFRERHIRPPEDVLLYLIRRIERSVPAARAVVARLDETALAEQRPVSRALAREILEDTGNLFD
jgi:chromosomal replication initiation ATPase DnaA